MIGTDIAIDLGTSKFKVYLDGKGIVLSEPSIIAVDNATDEVIAIGSEAYDMLGRTSERITVARPLCNGVISDFSMAEHLISHYLKEINNSRVFMPRVVVSVPCGITEVEKRAVVDAIGAAGVRKVCLIEEPVAAAIGARGGHCGTAWDDDRRYWRGNHRYGGNFPKRYRHCQLYPYCWG